MERLKTSSLDSPLHAPLGGFCEAPACSLDAEALACSLDAEALAIPFRFATRLLAFCFRLAFRYL